ncbi:MAG: serine/threonine protein kinase [Phycisphaeraceae bacterium]|nr:serine/threonine protein kinase [Phycisphaerales bacterium]MCB9843622.1 serine/threonine protein kinase [Phycisphaeraceae bacterium]
MSNNRYHEAAALFEKCVALDPPDRRAFLAEHCAGREDLRREVESLLDFDRPPASDATSPIRTMIESAFQQSAIEHEVPKQIGAFRVIREIGRGGMGIVYEAEQQEPRRRVAIKVLSRISSPEFITLMKREANLLARIEAPGVARVYESGTVRIAGHSTPYIVMELVEGVPIDEFATEHALTVRQRIELIAKTATALQSAHTRGVIHRDLKPANILVTPSKDGIGKPTIVDFGVARLLDTKQTIGHLRSDSSGLIGTLAYMSPEQRDGDDTLIDARSDIYSLGTVAYLVLSGREFCDLKGLSLGEALSKLATHTPSPLGLIDKSLRGDIQTVVAKATSREPNHRYETAASLSDDLRRILGRAPIHARQPRLHYLVGRFVARHKLLTAVSVLVTAFTIWSLIFVNWQHKRAVSEADISQAIAQFLEDMISSVSPNELGNDATVREAIEASEGRLAEQFATRPLVEARVQMVLGRTYRALGDEHASLSSYERAASLFERVLGPSNRQTLYAKGRVGVALRNVDDFDGAIQTLNEVLETQARKFGRADADSLTTMNSLAVAYARSGRRDDAERMHVAVLDAHRSRGVRDEPLFTSMHNLATLYVKSGRYEAALPLLAEAERGYGEIGGRTEMLVTMQIHGEALIKLNRFEEAQKLLRPGLELAMAHLPEDHWLIRVLQVRLGETLLRLGYTDEARHLLTQSLRETPTQRYFSMRDQAQALLDSIAPE